MSVTMYSRAGVIRIDSRVLNGPLGGRVELADRLDLVAEEVQADGQLLRRRPQIEQTAAAGELSRLEDSVDALKTDLRQVAQDRHRAGRSVPTASFLQALRKSRRGRVRVISERADVTKIGGTSGFCAEGR